jgi:hypothetical protein
MTDHPEFDFSDPRDDSKSVFARFCRFHNANPAVYELLRDLALRATVKRGRTKIGIAMLFEVLRWEFYLKADENEEFKLCNDYKAPYARLLMKQEPQLKDIFNLKKSRVDNDI